MKAHSFNLHSAIFLIAVSLSSCSENTHSHLDNSINKSPESRLFTPHDVAILIPYIDRPELLNSTAKLTQSNGDEGTTLKFIPKQVFSTLDRAMLDDDILRQSEGEAFGSMASNRKFESTFFTKKKDNFSLASIRIDPCANSSVALSKPGECHKELRLVWSEIIVTPSATVFATDASIHTIYELDDVRLYSLLEKIRLLKEDSLLRYEDLPLGPHPLLLDPQSGAKNLDKLTDIISEFANPLHLKSIAALGDTAPMFEGHWPMLMIDYSQGQLKPRLLEHVMSSEESKSAMVRIDQENGDFEFVDKQVWESPKTVQRLRGAQGTLSKASPKGILEAPYERLWQRETSREEKTDLRKKYVEHLFSRFDPVEFHVGNTDCGSCHTINSELDLYKSVFSDDMPMSIKQWHDTEWNLERSDEFADDSTALQMFSFFRSRYAVQTRSIFEAALSADRINIYYNNQR